MTLPLVQVFEFVATGLLVGGPVPEFGEQALHTRNNDTRKVVIVPGDDGRTFGKLGAPRGPGGSPKRRIATGPEFFRVYLAGYDAANPSSGLLQYEAASTLLDRVFPLLRNSARDFQTVSEKWVVNSLLAPFGAALMLVCSVQRSIIDWSEGEAVDAAPVRPEVTSSLVFPSSVE